MVALFRRASGGRKPAASRFAGLSLERLPERLSPSAIESITMNVTYLPDRQATFSGQLTGPGGGPIAGQVVNLTGVATGTATTNAQGSYSITLAIPQLGKECAASADGQSNTAQATLSGGTPVISSFTAVSLEAGLWEFSGTVTGAPVQGEIVNFAGIKALAGQSDTVNADGTFDFYAIVSTGQGGWATAQAFDWWGDGSAIAARLVNC